MANLKWRKIRARCPFYVSSSARTINCALDIEDKTRNTILRRHKDENSCDDYFKKFCAQRYTKCAVYDLICKMEGSR